MTQITDNSTDLEQIDEQIATLQAERRRLLAGSDTNLMVRTDANIHPKTYWPNIKYIIKYAFSIGEMHYFHFADFFNIPFERGLSTLTFWQELEMNCTRQFLKAASMATLNCLTLKQDESGALGLKIGDAERIQRILYSRLNMPKETELMYSFAAAVFFDQWENPLNYEYAYGNEKKAFWKKAVGLTDFFLCRPLQEFIPSIANYESNLEICDRLMIQETAHHWTLFREQLSSEQLTALSL